MGEVCSRGDDEGPHPCTPLLLLSPYLEVAERLLEGGMPQPHDGCALPPPHDLQLELADLMFPLLSQVRQASCIL